MLYAHRVVENEQVKILWDLFDKLVMDIVVVDKQRETSVVKDVAVAR